MGVFGNAIPKTIFLHRGMSDRKRMNFGEYGEIKKLLTTDDKGLAAQTLKEIHSTVMKAPTKRGAALRATAKLKKISEKNEIDYNENQMGKNCNSTKTTNVKQQDALPNLLLLSSSDDEDAEVSAEEMDPEKVLDSSDDDEGMLRDFTHRWSKLIPDWSEYAVPRLDLPDSEKDLEESIRKELESHCSLCKIPKKNCRCLGRDVLRILEKKT